MEEKEEGELSDELLYYPYFEEDPCYIYSRSNTGLTLRRAQVGAIWDMCLSVHHPPFEP